MSSKTPKFDALLQSILDGLVPHTIKCAWDGKHEYCEGKFEITNEDIEFLRMLRVPPPKFCPTCRRMRRLTHMNLSRLFKQPCRAPGHNEQLISIFPENSPLTIVDYQYFNGDDFDAFSFGKDLNLNESLLSQFMEFRKEVPMPSLLNRDPSSVNSDFSNGGRNNKNCYFTTGCYNSEDIWYSGLILKSKNIMSSRAIHNSEYVAYSLYSDYVYKSSHVYFSKNITDSMFIYDCKNVDQCFGCVNLRNAKYCILNEQKTKEEYENFINNVMPYSREFLQEWKDKFFDLVKSLPVNATRNISSQNVSGTNIVNSKDIFDVCEADGSQNVRHADAALSHHDSMDFLFSGGHSHHLYQTCNIGSQSSNVKFSISSKFITDSEFVLNCKLLTNCFMCIGIQNKSFCILNKQYTEEEYWPIVDDLKSKMLEDGEYGEFFDLSFSAQAYNFSMAGGYYPLPDEVAVSLGGYIGKEPETNVGDLEIIDTKNLSQTIDGIEDTILTKAIACEKTQKPFRIIKTELDFYRRMELPVPDVHPVVRIEENVLRMPTGRKWKVSCLKCGKSIETFYKNHKDYHLFCEECFSREVN